MENFNGTMTAGNVKAARRKQAIEAAIAEYKGKLLPGYAGENIKPNTWYKCDAEGILREVSSDA